MNSQSFSPLRYRFILPCLFLMAATACSSGYYNVLDKFGIEKRDILVDRIDDTQVAQEDAKEQFNSALEQYRSIVNIEGGELEDIYDRLNAEYKRCEEDAKTVKSRIDSVESVAEDLFDEWEREISEFSNASMARQSRSLLRETQVEYEAMLKAMRRAEKSMDPVLTLFSDQVLFLRHNLNARAIVSLKDELNTIELATATLITDMQRSIDEASSFIQSMK